MDKTPPVTMQFLPIERPLSSRMPPQMPPVGGRDRSGSAFQDSLAVQGDPSVVRMVSGNLASAPRTSLAHVTIPGAPPNDNSQARGPSSRVGPHDAASSGCERVGSASHIQHGLVEHFDKMSAAMS